MHLAAIGQGLKYCMIDKSGADFQHTLQFNHLVSLYANEGFCVTVRVSLARPQGFGTPIIQILRTKPLGSNESHWQDPKGLVPQ